MNNNIIKEANENVKELILEEYENYLHELKKMTEKELNCLKILFYGLVKTNVVYESDSSIIKNKLNYDNILNIDFILGEKDIYRLEALGDYASMSPLYYNNPEAVYNDFCKYRFGIEGLNERIIYDEIKLRYIDNLLKNICDNLGHDYYYQGKSYYVKIIGRCRNCGATTDNLEYNQLHHRDLSKFNNFIDNIPEFNPEDYDISNINSYVLNNKFYNREKKRIKLI